MEAPEGIIPERGTAPGTAAHDPAQCDHRDGAGEAEDQDGLLDTSTGPSRGDSVPEAEGAADPLAALAAAVAAGFDEIHEELRRKHAFDQFKQQQVDRLHAELQEHKQDLLGRVLRPLLHGLIRLHADLGRSVTALQQKPEEELSPERFFRLLDTFRDDLETLLERHGVHRFEAPGEQFDPLRQTALRTEPAADAQLAGRIIARLRPGFELEGTVLQKEGVAVSAAPKTSSAGEGREQGDLQ